MDSGKDAVPAFVKSLARDGYVFGVELIVNGNPGTQVEVFAEVEAIAHAWPETDNVPVDSLVCLVEFVGNPGIIAVGAEKESACVVQRKIVKLESHPSGILSKTAVAVDPLRGFRAKCAELNAKSFVKDGVAEVHRETLQGISRRVSLDLPLSMGNCGRES